MIPAPITVMSKPVNPYSTETIPELSKTEKLKQAFKDYGATLFLFHISMSLCSLGVWYLIITRLVLCNFVSKAVGYNHEVDCSS